MGLITNGSSIRQRDKIKRFNLEKYFDAILIEGEQEFGKPDIRIYQKAMDLCGVNPKQSCMVGDNYLWEVEAPIQYGLHGVWIRTENQELPVDRSVDPSYIIGNISELLKW